MVKLVGVLGRGESAGFGTGTVIGDGPRSADASPTIATAVATGAETRDHGRSQPADDQDDMTPPFRFVVLGDLRFWRSHVERDLGSRQQQLLLARLLASAGQSVSRGDIAELLWGDDPPARATNLIHRYIGNIRRLIQPDLPRRSSGEWLLSDGHRYRLDIHSQHLDLEEFRIGCSAGRRAAAEGRLDHAMRHYVTALRLWNGRFAAGIEPLTGSCPVFEMIDQECVAAVKDAARLATRTGHVMDVLPTVSHAARLNPLDERLHAEWMLLLAADGRHAEAILRYHNIRHRLTDELGLQPGRELAEAFDRILHRAVAPAVE